MKEFVPARWFRNYTTGDYVYWPGGSLDVGEEPPKDVLIFIPRRAVEVLKEYLLKEEPEGLLHTDRTEDLKIIHRLLDILKAVEEKP